MNQATGMAKPKKARKISEEGRAAMRLAGSALPLVLPRDEEGQQRQLGSARKWPNSG